ncbi:MAG TPA: condensation domain-containing protein [Candidatus Xenobia bacterium]|jgi:UDP:flavonoid glycosyltransferase YjiC (YdhE family)/thioesterase domain-containing protein
MRVVLPVRGSWGDVCPVVRVGQALRQRRHEVVVVAQTPYRSRVEAAGLAFEPMPGDFEAYTADEPLLIEPHGVAEFWRRHVLPTLVSETRLLARLAPDLLVLQPVFDVGGRLAAELHRIRTSWVFISPSMFTGAPVRLGLFQNLAADLNAVRCRLALPALEDFRPWVTWPGHVAGLWPTWFAPDLTGGPTPLGFPPQPNGPCEAERRLVLITGSTGRFLPDRLYQVAISACARLERQVLVLSSGLRSLPPGVEVIGFRPHAEVMPQALAVVHHGGVGTLAAALAFGVPQVVLAAGADRPDNGARLEALGVARCLAPPHWTEEHVTAALHDVLTSPEVAERCGHYRVLMQGDGTLTEVAGLLEQPPRVVAPAVSKDRLALAGRLLQMRRAVTATQERLWLFQQVKPHSTALNKVHALVLSGRLDRARLQQAMEQLLERHATLRTAFVWDEALCAVPAPSKPCWTNVDAHHIEPWQQNEFVEQTARGLVQEPYDLARGPLVRPGLVQLSDDVHVLLLGLHAVAADASSTALLWRDLGALYTGAPLPAPVSYADLTATRPPSQDLMAWWRDRLDGLTPTPLPRARPRPEPLSDEAGSHVLILPTDLRARLEALARDQQVSLLVVLLAAFKAWLWQETGHQDLAVGTRVTLRLQPASHRVVGPLGNTLVLRAAATGQPSFVELVQRVRDTLAEALEHQELPFQKLVETLNPPRQPNQHPFFSMVFYMHPEVVERVAEWGEVHASPRLVEKRTATDDLVVACRPVRDGLRCTFEYRTDLYDADTIQGMADDWRTLLERVVDRPRAPLHAPAPRPVAANLPLPVSDVVPGRAGELARVFGEVLGRDDVGVHDNFFRLGGHSMLALRLADRVSRWGGRTVPLSTLFEAPTPAALAVALEREWPAPGAVVTLQQGTAGDSLFLIHAADGGLAVYTRLISQLPGRTVYGLQALRDGAGFRHRDMETLARHYAEEIRRVQPAGPYHLVGLSLGARIGLHVIDRLPAADRGLVILLDGWGPGYPRYPVLPVRVGIHLQRAFRLPPAERNEYLRVRLEAGRQWAHARWRRLVHRLAPGQNFRHHFSPAIAAAPIPRYEGPVVLLRAQEQPTGCFPDPRLGWSESLLPNVRIEEVPGYHGKIVDETHVQHVAAAIQRALPP